MNKSLLLKLNIRLKNRFNLFKTIESRKGFTLVELIVVLTLIAILFSISIFSITGWLDWSKFQHENAAAEDIFYAAQNQLTELDSSGAINRVVKESLADSAHPEKYHSDYILADSNNNSLAGFYNSDGDEYSWDSIWKDNNKAKVERTIITLRAPAHSYDNYVGNRNSVDPDVRLLFDLIAPYISDKSILNGAIAIEFSPEAAQVFAVCYSDINSELEFSYDEETSKTVTNIKDRTLHVREQAMLGYFGIDTLTAKIKGRGKNIEGYQLEIENANTLNLILKRNGESVSLINDVDLLFTIKGATKYSDTKYKDLFTITVPKADLVYINNNIFTLERAAAEPRTVQVDFCNNSSLYSSGDQVTVKIPMWVDGGKIMIALDAADIQAQSVTYAKALGVFGDDGVDDAKEAFANTYSFYRFGFTNIRYINADVKITEADNSDGTVSAGRKPEGGKQFEIYSKDKIHGEAVTFANWDTDDADDSVYGIKNGRHLYNVRFESDYFDALKKAGLVSANPKHDFVLKQTISWNKDFLASGSLLNSSEASPKKVFGIDVYDTTNSPFPGFRMLAFGDSFSQVANLDSIKKGVAEDNTYYRLCDINISFAANCVYGVYGEDIQNKIKSNDTNSITEISKIGKSGSLPLGLFAESFGSISNIEIDSINVSGIEKNESNYLFTSKVGGFVGENLGEVSNLYIDDFEGVNTKHNEVIYTSYVRGRSDVGGILGHQYYKVDDAASTDVEYTISGCVNHAKVTGIGYVGGIIGRIYPSSKESFDLSYVVEGENEPVNYSNNIIKTYAASDAYALNEISKFTISHCRNYGEISMDPYFASTDIDNNTLNRGYFYGGITGAALWYVNLNNNNNAGYDLKENKKHAVISNCESYTIYSQSEIDKILLVTKDDNYNDVKKDTKRRMQANFVGGIVGGARYAYIDKCSTTPKKDDVSGGKVSFVFGDRYVGGIAGFSAETTYSGGENYTVEQLSRVTNYSPEAIAGMAESELGYRKNYSVINGTGVIGNYAVGGIAGAFGKPVVNTLDNYSEPYKKLLECNYGSFENVDYSNRRALPVNCNNVNGSSLEIDGLLNTAMVLGCSNNSEINSSKDVGYLYYGVGGIAGLLATTINNADNIQSENNKCQYLKYMLGMNGQPATVGQVINTDITTKAIKENVEKSKFATDGVGGLVGLALSGGNIDTDKTYYSRTDAVVFGRNRVGGAVGDTVVSSGGNSSLANLYPYKAVASSSGLYVIGNDGVGGLVGVFSDRNGGGLNQSAYYDNQSISVGFNVYGVRGVGGAIGIFNQDANNSAPKEKVTISFYRKDWSDSQKVIVKGSMFVGGAVGLQEGYYGSTKRYNLYLGCVDVSGSSDDLSKCVIDVKGDCFVGGLFGTMYSQNSNFPLDLMMDETPSYVRRLYVDSDICVGFVTGLYAHNDDEDSALTNNYDDTDADYFDNYVPDVNGASLNGITNSTLNEVNYLDYSLSAASEGDDYSEFINDIKDNYELAADKQDFNLKAFSGYDSKNSSNGKDVVQAGASHLSHVFGKIYVGGLFGFVPDFDTSGLDSESITSFITIKQYRNRANLQASDAILGKEAGSGDTSLYSYLGGVTGKIPKYMKIDDCYNTSPDSQANETHYNSVKATYKGGITEVNAGRISNCKNTAHVNFQSTINNTASFVGVNGTSETDGIETGVIENCVNSRTNNKHETIWGYDAAAGIAVTIGGNATISGCTNNSDVRTSTKNVAAGIVCDIMECASADNVKIENNVNYGSIIVGNKSRSNSTELLKTAGIAYNTRNVGVIKLCRNYSSTPYYAITSSDPAMCPKILKYSFDGTEVMGAANNITNKNGFDYFGSAVSSSSSVNMKDNFYIGINDNNNTPAIGTRLSNLFIAKQLYAKSFTFDNTDWKTAYEGNVDLTVPVSGYEVSGDSYLISDNVLNVANAEDVSGVYTFNDQNSWMSTNSEDAKLAFELTAAMENGVYNNVYSNLDKFEIIWNNNQKSIIKSYLDKAANSSATDEDYIAYTADEDNSYKKAASDYRHNIASYFNNADYEQYAYAIYLYAKEVLQAELSKEGYENLLGECVNYLPEVASNINIGFKLIVTDVNGNYISTSEITDTVSGDCKKSTIDITEFAGLQNGVNSNWTNGTPNGQSITVFKHGDFDSDKISKISVVVSTADSKVGIRGFYQVADGESVSSSMQKASISDSSSQPIDIFASAVTYNDVLNLIDSYNISLSKLYVVDIDENPIVLALSGKPTNIALNVDASSHNISYQDLDTKYITFITPIVSNEEP